MQLLGILYAMVPGSQCWALELAMSQLKWHETHPSALSRKIVCLLGGCHFQTQQKTCNRHGRMMESAIKKVQKLATKTSRWPCWRYPRCQAQASCCTRANLDLQGYKCNKASNDPQVVDRRQHFPRCEPSAVWLSCRLQRIAKCVSLSKSGRHLDFCSPQGKSRLSHLWRMCHTDLWKITMCPNLGMAASWLEEGSETPKINCLAAQQHDTCSCKGFSFCCFLGDGIWL